MNKIIFNGSLIEESEAKISILDRGYFFDLAVYSSLKVVQGKVFYPEYHVERLLESARLIGLEQQFRKEEVLKWINLLVEKNKLKDVLLRMVLIGDPDGGGVKLYIFSVGGLTFYPDKFYRDGVKVITFKGERRVPNSKTKDLLLSFMAYREAKRQGALDALLVDREGNIREGTRSNFYAIKNNVIYTPPASDVLEGVTKKILLDIVGANPGVRPTDKFKIEEKKIALKDIKNYDEFFMTSTSMNVMPINQIDDYKIESLEKVKEIINLFKTNISKISSREH